MRLAEAVTIGEAVGLALGAAGAFVFSPRRGRGLLEDVALGGALGGAVGAWVGLCAMLGG